MNCKNNEQSKLVFPIFTHFYWYNMENYSKQKFKE
uniref:Uncharacterized protein n=1 Tax=Heterorhabditis bacteriophora TaxID=37862 RepID=A0A1I7WEM8_HETBA